MAEKWRTCIAMKLTILIVILLLVSLTTSTYVNSVRGSADEASQKIAEAKNGLDEAYKATGELGSAGATMADLLKRLADASYNLTKSMYLYNMQDYNNAIFYATQSLSLSNKVAEEAHERLLAAQKLNNEKYLTSVLFSLSEVVIITLISLGVWVLFKRRYLKALANKKPQVVPNET
jgi:hypothetical protein